MTQYIESVVGDSGRILIEVSDARNTVGFGSPPSAEAEKRADNAFNQALKTIRLAASSVLETLQTLDEMPDSARIDFAIKFDSEARAMLAQDGSSAQLKVSLSWNTTSPTEQEK